MECLIQAGLERKSRRISGRRHRCYDESDALEWYNIERLLCRSVLRVLVTDKLASYGVATADAQRGAPSIGVPEQPGGELPPAPPGSGTGDEEVHLTGGAQRFLSSFSGISPHSRPRRYRLTAVQCRWEMTSRFATWNEVVGPHRRLTQATI